MYHIAPTSPRVPLVTENSQKESKANNEPLCLFNFYAEYIMRNAGLEEAQLESRLLGEISNISDTQMTPPLWRKVRKN